MQVEPVYTEIAGRDTNDANINEIAVRWATQLYSIPYLFQHIQDTTDEAEAAFYDYPTVSSFSGGVPVSSTDTSTAYVNNFTCEHCPAYSSSSKPQKM